MPRERFAWCLFDFANSAFNTVVVTFVFAAYFQRELVGDADRADVLWSRALALSGLIVGVLAPFLGSAADRSRRKRAVLVVSSLVCIAATAGLALVRREPGGPATDAVIGQALALVVVANVAFEIAFVFYNAFLPGLGNERDLGRLSGYGWSFGYVGGLLCLAVCLGCVGLSDQGGWVTRDGSWNVRSTNLVVAAWFLVFALPMFTMVRDRTPDAAATAPAQGPAWRRVLATLRGLREHPDLLRLLVSRLFYNDALIALISLASLYMGKTLGMSGSDIMVLAIWLNVVAGIGAFGFGYVDDFLGSKTAILASLALLSAGTLLAVLVPTPGAFWMAASLAGLGMGPNQSASRTLLARMTPPGREAELAGIFALSGKSTEWLGMILFAVVRDLGGSQRLAMLPLLLLFGLGAALMLGVDERRGIAAARAPTE